MRDSDRPLGDPRRIEWALGMISDFHAMNDPRSGFARVLRDLMETCPDCVIVGAVGVSFYVGNPRATKDVDIVIAAVDSLGTAFAQRFEWLQDKPFTAEHRETGIEVDVLTPDNPLVNAALLAEVPRRVKVFERAGIPVRVAAPELIIGLKLGRAARRSVKGLQDQADIAAIMNHQPYLDFGGVLPSLSAEERDVLEELLKYRSAAESG